MAVGALDRFRGWLETTRAGAAFVSDPVSIAYLTGFSGHPHERLMALILGSGEPVLIVPALDEAAASAAAPGVRVQGWRDGQDPWELVGATVGRPVAIAVEKEHLTLATWEKLRTVVGAEAAIEAGTEVRRLRARKSTDEVACLERAANLTDRVTELVLAELAAGRSEMEVAAGLDGHIAALGARPSFDTIVQSGPNTAQPHLGPGARRLTPGDLVLLDFGAAWEGYRADTTRMAVVGEPDVRQREVHDVVLAAHDAAVAAVRAGERVAVVDEAARAVIRAAGLGDHFIHRVGHGLGLEAHEAPSLEPGSDVVLEVGMVVTIEPGVYLPGWGGVRIEDDVVVEASGARLLTGADRRLRSV